MIVRWNARALNDLRDIRNYIARDAPPAAKAILSKLILRAEQLSSFPRSGPVVDSHRGRRIRDLVEGNYHLLYVVGEDAVFIVGVLHGKRDLRAFLRHLGKLQ